MKKIWPCSSVRCGRALCSFLFFRPFKQAGIRSHMNNATVHGSSPCRAIRSLFVFIEPWPIIIDPTPDRRSGPPWSPSDSLSDSCIYIRVSLLVHPWILVSFWKHFYINCWSSSCAHDAERPQRQCADLRSKLRQKTYRKLVLVGCNIRLRNAQVIGHLLPHAHSLVHGRPI